MLKDVVTNVNYLNNILTEKDFDFINNFDDEIKNMNQKISNQENVRDGIVELISSIADVLNLNDPEIDNYTLYKYSNELASIFETINANIQMLSDLKTKLDSLDSEIITLLLNVENSTHPESYFDNIIHNIKSKIDDYSTLSERTNSKLESNNAEINTFLNKPDTRKYLAGFNIVLNNLNNLNNESNTSTVKSFKYDSNEKDNNVLIISEKDDKVFLPYKVEEINEYLEQFPDQYSSFESVVAKEYILPLSYYMTHPVIARFREAYSLCRDREAKTIFESLKYGMDLMFNRRLNPAIIAACKTQAQLSNYINCLEKNDLKHFTDFEIRFEVSPF